MHPHDLVLVDARMYNSVQHGKYLCWNLTITRCAPAGVRCRAHHPVFAGVPPRMAAAEEERG